MPPLYSVPAYRYQQPLSRYITCQGVCVQQSHAAKRLISNLKGTEDLSPCYCYAIKTNSRTTRLQIWQPAPAGKERT